MSSSWTPLECRLNGALLLFLMPSAKFPADNGAAITGYAFQELQ